MARTSEVVQGFGVAPRRPGLISGPEGLRCESERAAVSLREFVIVLMAAAAVTVFMTYPLAFRAGSVGRVNLDDGRWSIWSVAWVAHTIVVDPLNLYNANIFYPHRATLAYSENNIGAGILAVPAYWATRNPYFAHNSVVLVAFVLSAIGMYFLVRRLTGDRRAAVVSGLCFAFCPYVFGHTAHIQLMITAGLPFSMLAFHRVAERPGPGRGAVLGMSMAAEAIACGYYGLFVVLVVGFATIFVAMSRSPWHDRQYWLAIGVGALVAIAIVGPLFVPYVRFQENTGFSRPLGDAIRFSADWRSYLASAAYSHSWMLRFLGRWNEVAFPGFVASICGVAGALMTIRAGRREPLLLYALITVLAAWASFGPPAGLYTILYKILPPFHLLHAPARFAIVVVFGLCVLTGFAVAGLLKRTSRPAVVAAAIAAAAVAELAVRVDYRAAPPIGPAYERLASLPRGPVVELPFFEQRRFYPRHTVYMLASTSHWMPLVNGYSDYFPPEFRRDAVALAPFPFPSAFRVLQRDRVRYALVHLNMYDAPTRADVEKRLIEFAQYLRPLYEDADTRLYEIVGFPDSPPT